MHLDLVCVERSDTPRPAGRRRGYGMRALFALINEQSLFRTTEYHRRSVIFDFISV